MKYKELHNKIIKELKKEGASEYFSDIECLGAIEILSGNLYDKEIKDRINKFLESEISIISRKKIK